MNQIQGEEPTRANASLLIVEEAARGTTIVPLKKQSYWIGRSSNKNKADIRLSSDIVSRKHGEYSDPNSLTRPASGNQDSA